MFEQVSLKNLDEYFTDLNQRQTKGVFFYRINAYNESVKRFVTKYYDLARKTGVVIEGKIPNPDEKNLAYYNEMMGTEFKMDAGFIEAKLRKWLPRMNDYQRGQLSGAIYSTLDDMRKQGKNEGMLKNCYVKFMCWLYYKFERIVSQLGANTVPKILYEGSISNYELKLIIVLNKAGCDVVFLQYAGDASYLALDPKSEYSRELRMQTMEAFPPEFSVKWLREEANREANLLRMYGPPTNLVGETNTWIGKGNGMYDVAKGLYLRGKAPNTFYNCFIRINGVENKMTFQNDLYQFHGELVNSKRKPLIFEHKIPQPEPQEIAAIKRQNYPNIQQAIMELAGNIIYAGDVELRKLIKKAFIVRMMEYAGQPGATTQRITNRATYLLCWLNRYQAALFAGWKLPNVGCVIFLGACHNENEADFLRMLARLPVDVLLLHCDQNVQGGIEDSLIREVNYEESMELESYPLHQSNVRMGTVAYQAERELDTLMYQDTGIYRDRQYSKAESITLQTMYEEISILWNQEMKYRPNFGVNAGVVNLPVIFAKISGVKDGKLDRYWSGIKALLVQDTLLVKNPPMVRNGADPMMNLLASDIYKNRKLQKERLKNHPSNPFGVLREEMLDHILCKLEYMIEQRTIKGIFENGTEYRVLATVLSMDKDMIRTIQKFDFTKRNPKVVYINTTDTVISLDDTIMLTFLNLVGFDIAIFVPTGYQSIEKYMNTRVMEEHQIGEYIYDLNIPDFNQISSVTRQSWRDKIFKR